MSRRRSVRDRPPDRTEAVSPGPAGGELVGDLDGPLAVVGPDGTVAPLGARWCLGWAVGAEDRWHIASEEAAVRSRLIDDMPVTETAMRTPGGDVLQRVAAARRGPSRGLVLEFENATRTPVSLAVAVIENDAWGGSAARRRRRSGDSAEVQVLGSTLMADGQVALDLGRVPGGAVAVADGRVWSALEAVPTPGDCKARSRSGRAAAAAVVPFVPGAPLRALAPVGGALDRDAAPSEAAVGWQAVVARAATVSLPDDAAVRAWSRGLAASILAAGGEGTLSPSGWVSQRARRPDMHDGTVAPVVRMARTAVVLDRVGLPDEADRARGRLLEAVDVSMLSSEAADAALGALASRRLRSGRTSQLADLAGPLAFEAGDFLQRRTLEQVAAALDSEAPAAARDARRMLADLVEQSSRGSALSDLAGTVRRSLDFGGDGLAGLEALLDCLVAEASDHLVVAPALPDEWTGAPIDVSSLATRHGMISFSLRWHGPRPALLWDLQPPADGSSRHGVTIRCGLDRCWSSTTTAGEALLGPA